jgi:pimeloyl-ACP methyl ester carboxylesterase
VTSTTTAGILVLGTRFDPATPYAWARNLSAQLPTSRLLTYVGDGHTAYGEESECVQRIVDTYLVSGALPEPGARC